MYFSTGLLSLLLATRTLALPANPEDAESTSASLDTHSLEASTRKHTINNVAGESTETIASKRIKLNDGSMVKSLWNGGE
jgi:hypothetical protein